MKKIKLKIEGMHCSSCAMSIDGDLEDYVKGITSAKTSYAKQICEVDFDETKTKPDDIIEQIEETGYRAQISND